MNYFLDIHTIVNFTSTGNLQLAYISIYETFNV